MHPAAAVFLVTFTALYTAHMVGDHWVQTHTQALTKALPGWPGRLACARQVATLTATKAVALLAAATVTGTPVSPARAAAALAFDAASHYLADRRTPLATLAALIGKTGFYQLGAPRTGHDDAPHLGTGAYALDQSWHIAFIFITALLIAA
jgi:hypothetical protein